MLLSGSRLFIQQVVCHDQTADGQIVVIIEALLSVCIVVSNI